MDRARITASRNSYQRSDALPFGSRLNETPENPMFRKLFLAAAAALVIAMPVEAKRAIRIFTPVEKLVRADAVVIGKVSALEKDTVTAAPLPGAEKITYKIAVIKVESGLVGAANVTHVKVGFIPPPPADPA